MLTKRLADKLDGGDFGWLKAKHHFAVSPQGNAENRPLGPIVVWNDDEIAPGTGFGMHGHRDMEIISYVREGTVTHRDSIGNEGQTTAGDVQVMSAGTGIRHAEDNQGPTPLRVFQIWIRPRKAGIAPRWASRQFPREDRQNQMVVLATGSQAHPDALPIEADADVMGATLVAGAQLRHSLAGFKYAYIAPAKGEVRINGQDLVVGDGLAVTDEHELAITAVKDSELILVVAN